MRSPIRQHDLQVDRGIGSGQTFCWSLEFGTTRTFRRATDRAVSKREYGGLRRTDVAVITVGISGQSGTGSVRSGSEKSRQGG